jgi:hypothetical protein
MHNDESSIWYSFLEDECDSNNGLFCFYDADKSCEVALSCLVLANEMAGFLDENSGIDEISEISE